MFELIRWTRRIREFLWGHKEERHELRIFQLGHFLIEDIEPNLRKCRYYYNTYATTYKRQIYTARKLIDKDFQIHIRFFSDGWVSGHYELRPEIHPLEHAHGVEFRLLSQGEVKEIKYIIGGWVLYGYVIGKVAELSQ